MNIQKMMAQAQAMQSKVQGGARRSAHRGLLRRQAWSRWRCPGTRKCSRCTSTRRPWIPRTSRPSRTWCWRPAPGGGAAGRRGGAEEDLGDAWRNDSGNAVAGGRRPMPSTPMVRAPALAAELQRLHRRQEHLSWPTTSCARRRMRPSASAPPSPSTPPCAACSVCNTLTEVCSRPERDGSVLCVVEDPGNVAVIEKTREFRGRYHVLWGALSPLKGIGPDEIDAAGLVRRVTPDVREVLHETNPKLRGRGDGPLHREEAQAHGRAPDPDRVAPARRRRHRVRRRGDDGEVHGRAAGKT